jgi:molybdopterin biosynthesis enzyme
MSSRVSSPVLGRTAAAAAAAKAGAAAAAFRTARLDHNAGTVEVLAGQGAGAVGSVLAANVWVALPVGVEVVEAGDEVDVWPLCPTGACAFHCMRI